MLVHLSCCVCFMLAFSQLTVAQVPFPNQCPQVKVMDTFDVDAYMGVWYEYSKYPFVFEIGKKCMYAKYENIGNNTVSVVNSAISRFTGHSTNVTGEAKVIAPGQLAVMFSNKQLADRPNYLVLGTDYTSYGVVYSCNNFTTFAHTEIIWILTRERKPARAAVSAAKKIIDDNKLSQEFLIETMQENCPERKEDAANASNSGKKQEAIAPASDPEAVAAFVESLDLEQANAIDRA